MRSSSDISGKVLDQLLGFLVPSLVSTIYQLHEDITYFKIKFKRSLICTIILLGSSHEIHFMKTIFINTIQIKHTYNWHFQRKLPRDMRTNTESILRVKLEKQRKEEQLLSFNTIDQHEPTCFIVCIHRNSKGWMIDIEELDGKHTKTIHCATCTITFRFSAT